MKCAFKDIIIALRRRQSGKISICDLTVSHSLTMKPITKHKSDDKLKRSKGLMDWNDWRMEAEEPRHPVSVFSSVIKSICSDQQRQELIKWKLLSLTMLVANLRIPVVRTCCGPSNQCVPVHNTAKAFRLEIWHERNNPHIFHPIDWTGLDSSHWTEQSFRSYQMQRFN